MAHLEQAENLGTNDSKIDPKSAPFYDHRQATGDQKQSNTPLAATDNPTNAALGLQFGLVYCDTPCF